MSLINEALKRARLEAARRDAADKGVPASALPTYTAPRRNPWLAPLLGFVGGIAVVGIAGGGFWWMQAKTAASVARENAAQAVTEPEQATQGTSPVSTSPAPVTTTPQAAASAVVQPAQPDIQSLAAPPPTASPPTAVVPTAVSSPSPPPRAERSRDVAPAEAPQEERPEPVPIPESLPASESMPVPESVPASEPARTRVEASRPPASATSAGPISYRRQTTLANGKTLKLDFIVWSEARPFAQINGELVNPGQMVEGYVLAQIERDRVELKSDQESFWLRVK